MYDNIGFLHREWLSDISDIDIIKKYGSKCAISDFAILLGGVVSSTFFTSDGDKTGAWWMVDHNGFNYGIGEDGNYDQAIDEYQRSIGGRPVIHSTG